MSKAPILVWFRQDLRLEDQPLLHWAVESGHPVVPVYLWSPEEEGSWAPGGASRWWLHQSLVSLGDSLMKAGSQLIIRQGSALELLRQLVAETGAGAVGWSRRYEPAIIERDKQVKAQLKADGIDVKSFNSALLNEPWAVENLQGEPYKVFTPYWKAVLSKGEPVRPIPAPGKIPAPKTWPESVELESLQLMPKIPWDGGLKETWTPGEIGAQRALDAFRSEAVGLYLDQRDIPGEPGTSRLSPYLHFGELSPRQIWWAIRDREEAATAAGFGKHAEGYLRQLVWREFAHMLLYHFPHTPTDPLRAEFEKFPWRDNKAWLRAWQRGETGYPLVDAGMRELWHTGWMHNRVRMVVASLLVKHLQIPWQRGAEWFWDTLVDADLANNTLGWQWTAGCGADAAPYFRVFNPMTQSQKFDANGVYLRNWLPELVKLPDAHIHEPWAAPANVLANAGIRLGTTYPMPIVDHKQGREQALEAYETIKKSRN